MSYPIVRFPGTTASRGPSAELWRNALDRLTDADSTIGLSYFTDFNKEILSTTSDAAAHGDWFIQDMAAGGTSESLQTGGDSIGVATLSAATGTAHFGIEMWKARTAAGPANICLPTHSTTGYGDVIFEARCDLDDADAMFVGLTEGGAEFLSATSTLPDDEDYIGFYRTAAGDLQFVVRNDNNAGTAVEDNTTIIAAASIASGYNKLGFRVNVDQTVEIWVNETQYKVDTSGATITVATTALPIESLLTRFAIGRGAGSSTTVDLPIDFVGYHVEF